MSPAAATNAAAPVSNSNATTTSGTTASNGARKRPRTNEEEEEEDDDDNLDNLSFGPPVVQSAAARTSADPIRDVDMNAGVVQFDHFAYFDSHSLRTDFGHEVGKQTGILKISERGCEIIAGFAKSYDDAYRQSATDTPADNVLTSADVVAIASFVQVGIMFDSSVIQADMGKDIAEIKARPTQMTLLKSTTVSSTVPTSHYATKEDNLIIVVKDVFMAFTKINPNNTEVKGICIELFNKRHRLLGAQGKDIFPGPGHETLESDDLKDQLKRQISRIASSFRLELRYLFTHGEDKSRHPAAAREYNMEKLYKLLNPKSDAVFDSRRAYLITSMRITMVRCRDIESFEKLGFWKSLEKLWKQIDAKPNVAEFMKTQLAKDWNHYGRVTVSPLTGTSKGVKAAQDITAATQAYDLMVANGTADD